MKVIKDALKGIGHYFAIHQVHCPQCYPDKEPEFVDGGIVHHNQVIEWEHKNCGTIWQEEIKLKDSPFTKDDFFQET